MNTDARDIRKLARSLGWELLRWNGKHEIWQSPSGHRMPLPGTPGGIRTMQNIRAKLRRYA